MPTSSPKLIRRYNIRSTSFPVRSHPNTNKIEQELNNLKSIHQSSSPTSKTIHKSLSSLTVLYKYIGEFFNIPAVQQTLAQTSNNNMVDVLLDGSVRYLDICSKTSDVMLLMKESLRDLQSAIRRKKCGEFRVESYISAYMSLRKRMKKEIARSLVGLREIENLFNSSIMLDNVDNHVITVIQEASLVTGLIFQLLLSFLSTPEVKSSAKPWTLVSKLVKTRTTECQQESGTELEIMEGELKKLSTRSRGQGIGTQRIEAALEKLEVADLVVEDFEHGLEGLFRRMIEARVSLLNIFSI